ncbi:hypothetical protein DH2020_044369 [Rehmannia glutinosa]|uniref:Anthranilate synthase n=1 Tax=Rehmannia glutinosa TaxID=99300 RepID=A0ABR0UH49_REHGL
MQVQALTFPHRPSPAIPRVSPASAAGIYRRNWSSSVALRLGTFQCCASKSSSLVVDEKRFLEASENGNVIPLYKCIFSGSFDTGASLPMLGSIQCGWGSTGNGSCSKENKVTILDHDAGTIIEKIVEDPMTIPRSISEGWRPQLIQDLPDALCDSLPVVICGFLDTGHVLNGVGPRARHNRYDECLAHRKKLPFSNAPKDDRNLADIHLGLYDDVIVFDHVDKKAYVIHWVRLDRYSSAKKAYDDGIKRLETLVSKVQDIDPPRLSPGCIDFCTRDFGLSLDKSNMTSEEYMKAARGCILVASSPEILTRVKRKKIVNRPLAGTTRRGKTLHEDEMLEMKLLKDEKQCAEHIMLVDLGRNDVGKVSKSGSVKVEKLMTVERYSHVMHISSTVTGELLDHLTGWDALTAALPVGTVSGAPKVKAMELIDQLEATRRGPYSGGFGGISFLGDMDIALALRTIVFPTGFRFDTMYSYRDGNRRREWVAHLQSGAGIVADSVPDDEQLECERKAAGLARAIDLAESAFVNKSCSKPAEINGSSLPVQFPSSKLVLQNGFVGGN